MRAVLMPAIGRLRPDHRAVIALHYSVGMTIADVANVLGIPSGTAKSRLNSALEALRRAIPDADE